MITDAYMLGNKVRKIRQAAGLSQQSLSEKAGINIRQIQKMEKGEINLKNISAKNIVLIASALDTTAENLLK